MWRQGQRFGGPWLFDEVPRLRVANVHEVNPIGARIVPARSRRICIVEVESADGHRGLLAVRPRRTGLFYRCLCAGRLRLPVVDAVLWRYRAVPGAHRPIRLCRRSGSRSAASRRRPAEGAAGTEISQASPRGDVVEHRPVAYAFLVARARNLRESRSSRGRDERRQRDGHDMPSTAPDSGPLTCGPSPILRLGRRRIARGSTFAVAIADGVRKRPCFSFSSCSSPLPERSPP